ncbi:MAG: TetR family transcriptional regulator [Flavobacteriales bacterium]|jgi:AcrR family transcriptional regulator|nr:TetR family transcriptional regulator [Flavobacteriales bacterium]
MNKENEKIRNAALHLFNTKGLVSTSLEDIYTAAEISQEKLQELYPSKKSLVSEIYTLGKNDMFKFVYGEVLEIEDYQSLMRKVFHQSVIWGLSNRSLFNFMNQVQAHPYSWTETSDEKIYPSVNEKILARTTQAIKEEVIKEFPLDFVVHFMTGMHASCVSYILSLNAVTEEEYADLIEPMYQACWDAFKKH